MPYVSADVYVDLDDFDDDELIDELESRGYKVFEFDGVVEEKDRAISEEIIWRYTRGYIEDAMILLERKYPELYGISKLIRS